MRMKACLVVLAVLSLAGCAVPPPPVPPPAPAAPVVLTPPPPPPSLPAQTGTATYFANKLKNRKMADGARFDPRSDSAAHLTLPLGSKAEVTNLKNGKTAIVTIRDRGPHVKGYILDVSPMTAELLDMKRAGTAQVSVRPLAQSDTANRPVAER